MKVLPFLLATALLCSCAAPMMNTPSGRPETTIVAPRDQVKSALISDLVNKHYIIREDEGSVLMAEGDAGGWLDFWFTNTLTGERPRVRVRYTIIDEGQQTRVIAAIAMAYAPGFSGRQSEEEFTNPKLYSNLQQQLDSVRFSLDGQ